MSANNSSAPNNPGIHHRVLLLFQTITLITPIPINMYGLTKTNAAS